MTFSPMMQYVYFPEYKRDAIWGIRQLPFKRVWLEYVHTLILLFFYSKIPGNSKSYRIGFFVFAYFLLNSFQFINATDSERALNGFWLSVVNPSVFGLIVNKVLVNHRFSESKISAGIFRYYIIVFVLFYAISVFNFFRVGAQFDPDYEGLYIYGIGSGMGIFRDRIIMTIVFFYLPILFVPKKYSIREKLNARWYVFFVIASLLMLLLCNSRTMYIVTLVMLLFLFFYNPYKNRTDLFRILVSAMLIFFCINLISSGNSITEIISSRFTNQGTTALQSAENDERFEMWDAAIKLSKESNYLGIGFAHFHLMYSGRAGNYSNAHSMYYTTLSERGIGALLWLIITIITILCLSYKYMKKKKLLLPSVIFIGTICFSIVVYTGEDLFNVSQVAYSLSPYFLFMILSICFSYKNISDK